MQLTKVECLTGDWTTDDVDGISAVMVTTFPTTPSALLRWGKVKESDAKSYLRDLGSRAFTNEFKLPRITSMEDGGALPSEQHADHLVIRDLDLEKPNVVAHAGYKFYPVYPAPGEESERPVTAQISQPYPKGFGKDLHIRLNGMVETTLVKVFQGLPCFSLESISTKAPSHVRKGLAKSLVEWIFPYAERFNLPIVLSASPLGFPLYRRCGFEEFRQHDVKIDLAEYGGEGIHYHVLMVRWPSDVERLPDAWKEWRQKNPVTTAF